MKKHRVPTPPKYERKVEFGYTTAAGRLLQYRYYEPVHSHGPPMIHVVETSYSSGGLVEELIDVIEVESVQVTEWADRGRAVSRFQGVQEF